MFRGRGPSPSPFLFARSLFPDRLLRRLHALAAPFHHVVGERPAWRGRTGCARPRRPLARGRLVHLHDEVDVLDLDLACEVEVLHLDLADRRGVGRAPDLVGIELQVRTAGGVDLEPPIVDLREIETQVVDLEVRPCSLTDLGRGGPGDLRRRCGLVRQLDDLPELGRDLARVERLQVETNLPLLEVHWTPPRGEWANSTAGRPGTARQRGGPGRPVTTQGKRTTFPRGRAVPAGRGNPPAPRPIVRRLWSRPDPGGVGRGPGSRPGAAAPGGRGRPPGPPDGAGSRPARRSPPGSAPARSPAGGRRGSPPAAAG